MDEFIKAKDIIREYFEDANCGLFFTRNTTSDPMETIFKGERIKVDICIVWSYFEIFGLTEEEQKELTDYYDQLEERRK